MTTGGYISIAAHAVLILFLLFGGLLSPERLSDLAVADVTVISEEDFAALTRPDAAPELVTDTPVPAVPPTQEPPEITARPEDARPEAAEPDRPADPPPTDAPAEELPQPAPEAEVSDVLPPVKAPPIPDERPEAPQENTPAPAHRVAPQPAAPAPPEVERAPDVVAETAPALEPDTPVEPEEAAAPEEATTEIVTEAEETASAAPATSPRPRSRPARRAAPEPTETAETEPASDPVANAIAQAVAEANAIPAPAAAPTGPPLNFGEREALRVAVSRCWDVDVGGRSANVTVTVGVEMNRDGTVAGSVVRQISATGGDAAAQRTAFEKARRAILRCQSGGFPLPVEKYDHWRQIEMTFNPEGMRLK